IGNNNITGNFPSSGWPNFWDLRHFDADNNGITGSISCEFWQRIDNTDLKWVDLSYNNLDGNATSCKDNVQGHSSLTIRVGGNNF
ncbi:hypothetical protein NC796_26370, partial [Aliifodinibius sp. S!AR15-10]|uniref:hypothetical protein n=1 Tax=Aliifodinibius sp. S!AR15-10 TaxID=2950437 RepID=UPI0028649C95